MTGIDPVSTVTAAVVSKAFGELLTKLTANVLGAAGKPISAAYEAITTNFEPHLEATYQRCTKIKTILNREEPVDLLSIYVGSNFHCAKEICDDHKMIEEIRRRKRVVICGTGGTGKTIFMKYLWLSLFEDPQGKIPAFIELRKLNDLSSDNVKAYIHHSIVNTHSKVSVDAFEKTMAKGAFAFLFDGFDEVAPDKRASIGKQIQELAENNPDCIVVVSSRPDDELFGSWQGFSTFKVQPLSQKQSINLIQKLQYDESAKAKFVSRVEKDLYRQHESFLSVPLLATMMLMTFSDFGDIPEKTHLFYEKAFDTLFYKHDAVKGLFQRKMYTGLPVDSFKRLFSSFCLVSYFDGKYQFEGAELDGYLKKCLKIEKIQVDVGKFLKDLVESVCILQLDGSQYIFSHRSFQEYFTAFCLDRVIPDRVGKVLDKIAGRGTDTTLEMLFDMNARLVEDAFVLPVLATLERDFKRCPKEEFLWRYSAKMDTKIELRFGSGKLIGWMIHSDSDADRLLFAIGKLLEGKKFSQVKEAYYEKDEAIVSNVFPGGSLNTEKTKPRVKPENRGTIAIKVSEIGDGKYEFHIDHDGTGVPRLEEVSWLKETGYAQYCVDRVNTLLKIKARVLKRQKAQLQTIDELLEI